MDKKNVLVLGAMGQIGSEFINSLKQRYPDNKIIPTDIRGSNLENFIKLDILDKRSLECVILGNKVDEIYTFAALLSAVGEKKPDLAWSLNMDGLKNILDVSIEQNEELKKEGKSIKIFWPSSIAAFGPTTPKYTPQETIMKPSTMYGVTKVAGELLCNYYFERHGLDVRSLRFPGILSYKTDCGGGTTDYAVEMVRDAVKKGSYECFVKPETVLPLMYIDDCLKSMHQIMEAPKEKITVHDSYNLEGVSFSAKQLEDEIKKHIPDFKCTYKPDFRQKIADSWPQIIDDIKARSDWGWKPEYNLENMVVTMIEGFKEQ